MDLSYAPEYERYREELRAFLARAWTDEDRAHAGEEQVIGGSRKPTARETEFRQQAAPDRVGERDVARRGEPAHGRPEADGEDDEADGQGEDAHDAGDASAGTPVGG